MPEPVADTGTKKKGIDTWVKTHKPEAALGVGAIVVTIALYVRSKNSSSTSTGSTSTAEPVATDDTSATDYYSGLEDQVLGLQQALLGLSTQQSTPTTSTQPSASSPAPSAPGPYAGETMQGSGYGPGSGSALDIAGLGGGEYAPIFSAQTAGSLEASGVPLYYQPGQGVFNVVTPGSNLLAGTPLFEAA